MPYNKDAWITLFKIKIILLVLSPISRKYQVQTMNFSNPVTITL